MQAIAHIRTGFPTKFGIPRQAGLVPEVRGEIVFLPAFRNPHALRGLEGFSHLWLLWEFSETKGKEWSPTVRPPRLGGNERVGVFATRSPFRPNPIGLSCVRLLGIREDAVNGHVLCVAGADLMDGTPIYDIKPYLAYTDAHPEARDGFAGPVCSEKREVIFPPDLQKGLPPALVAEIAALLAQDPRPSYQEDETRIYGMPYAGYDVRFRLSGEAIEITEIVDIKKT